MLTTVDFADHSNAATKIICIVPSSHISHQFHSSVAQNGKEKREDISSPFVSRLQTKIRKEKVIGLEDMVLFKGRGMIEFHVYKKYKVSFQHAIEV
jgi:hypothetical protein